MKYSSITNGSIRQLILCITRASSSSGIDATLLTRRSVAVEQWKQSARRLPL
jgi:hypothetical protein